MLLGVLSHVTWLRLYPMNLICIITAQGNGMESIVVVGLDRAVFSGHNTFYDDENHDFEPTTFGSDCRSASEKSACAQHH